MKQFLSRDASLISIECWYKGRVHNFKDYTGLDFPVTAFRHKNGSFDFLIDDYAFEHGFPVLLSKWIQNNSKKFYAVRLKMVRALKFFRISKNRKFKSAGEILNALAKAAGYFEEAFIGNFISHHLPRYHDNFIEKGHRLFDDALVNRVMKWREAEGNIFFNEGVDTIDFLINSISAKTGWNFEELRLLTFNELMRCIKAGQLLYRDNIGLRKQSVFYYFDERVMFEYEFDSKIGSLGYRLDEERLDVNKIIIKGTTANIGYAKGNTRVILNRKEINKFQAGDILVAPMTSPWYVPLMEKASAIVTDEGGITCHAAIISREMNKPCVIGTKFATKVLKDGDLVEVDANKGIVKKLK